MASFYRVQLEKFKSQLVIEGDLCIDVGGAERPISKSCKEFKAKRLILVDHASVPGYETFVWDMNVNLEARLKDHADVVTCFELMEYIWNPVICARNLLGLLKPGGILYISFPFVYPVHKPVDIDYMRYTRVGAEKILTQAGFVIKNVVARRIAAPGALRSAYSADGMHMADPANADDTGYIITAMRPEAGSRTPAGSEIPHDTGHQNGTRGSAHEAAESIEGEQRELARESTS